MGRSIFRFSLSVSVILALLFIYGSSVQNGFVWGFNIFSFLPFWCTLAYLASAAVLIWLSVKKSWKPAAIRLGGLMEQKPYHFLAVSVGIYLIFAWVLRAATPVWGDGIYIVKNFSEALSGQTPLDLRNEPLATVYFYGAAKMLNVTSYEALKDAYLAATMVLGAAFLITLFFIVRNLFEGPSQRFLSFIFLLAFPYMELFFGYMETYGITALAAAIYVLCALLFIRGKLSFSGVAASFFFMGLTHYLSLLFFPSLLYAGYLDYRKNGLKSLLKGSTVLGSLTLLVLFMINFDLQNFYAWTPHSHILPLTPGEDNLARYTEPYTLFSAFHFSELLNYFLLLGGIPLAAIVFTLAMRRDMIFGSGLQNFFLFSGVPMILLTFILKFDLGLAKDWDVMAPYFPLLALWAAWLISSQKPERFENSLGLLAAMAIISTLPFLAVHARQETSVKRYVTLFEPRTVSNYGFYASTMSLALFSHQIGDKQGSVEAWNRYTGLYKYDPQGYQNLVTNLKSLGPAGIPYNLNTFEKWIGNVPTDTSAYYQYAAYCIDAGNYFFGRGELKGAEAVYRRAVALDPYYDRAHNNLGSVLAQDKQLDSALVHFERAVELNPAYADPYYNIGSIEEERGNLRKAKEYYRKAAELKNNAAIEKLSKIK